MTRVFTTVGVLAVWPILTLACMSAALIAITRAVVRSIFHIWRA